MHTPTANPRDRFTPRLRHAPDGDQLGCDQFWWTGLAQYRGGRSLADKFLSFGGDACCYHRGPVPSLPWQRAFDSREYWTTWRNRRCPAFGCRHRFYPGAGEYNDSQRTLYAGCYTLFCRVIRTNFPQGKTSPHYACHHAGCGLRTRHYAVGRAWRGIGLRQCHGPVDRALFLPSTL